MLLPPPAVATPYAGSVQVKQVGGGAPAPWSSVQPHGGSPFELALPCAAPAWAPLGSALAPFGGGFGWAEPLAPFGFGGGDALGLAAAADPQLRALVGQVSNQMADVTRRLYTHMPQQMAIDIKGEAAAAAAAAAARWRAAAAAHPSPLPRRPCCAPLTRRPRAARAPRAESDTEYDVQANLPGVKKECITIETSRADSGDAQLSITAERVARERSDEPETWHRKERVASVVRRTLALPANVDLAGITSRLDHGVLRIVMKKHPASQIVSEARTIPIA